MNYPGYELSALDRLHRAEEIRRHWGKTDQIVPRTPLLQRVRHFFQRSA